MIPVLHTANATDFSTFGIGVLTDTVSCEVTEERNGVFEWDNFTVKFHSHRGQKTGVVIEYGKNLTAPSRTRTTVACIAELTAVHFRCIIILIII